AGAVGAALSRPTAAPAVALSAADRVRRAQAGVLRGPHNGPPRNESTAAVIMPPAARPASLYIRGRSAVGTRGSGGRPYTSGSSSSRKTDPVPPTPSSSLAP